VEHVSQVTLRPVTVVLAGKMSNKNLPSSTELRLSESLLLFFLKVDLILNSSAPPFSFAFRTAQASQPRQNEPMTM